MPPFAAGDLDIAPSCRLAAWLERAMTMTTNREAIEKLCKAAATGQLTAEELKAANARRWQRGVSVTRLYNEVEPSLRDLYAELAAAKESHDQCPGIIQARFKVFSNTATQMLAVAVNRNRDEDLTQNSFLWFHEQLAEDSRRLLDICEAVLQEADDIPVGEVFTDKSLPAEYREGGKADGVPLVLPYLETDRDWKLGSNVLAGLRRDSKVQSVDVLIEGKPKKAHLYSDLLKITRERSKRDSDDDNEGR